MGNAHTPFARNQRLGAGIAITALTLAAASPASAHVKWFAPYIVGAKPRL